MPTTFANTINGNPIYASRAESDKDGNRIDTTYAKLSDIPPGVTVDQTYNSSSTNAQSGTAVAEAVSDALSTINQVPASTSSDEDKVLTVDSNGDPVWAVSQSGGSTYTAGNGIVIDNDEISVDTDVVQEKLSTTEMDAVDSGITSNLVSTYSGHVADSTIHVTSSDKSAWNAKQDAISDLATIRSGASAGATAVQPGDLATVATSGSYNDLLNKPTIPAAQVNANWNASSGVSQILNKPNVMRIIPGTLSSSATSSELVSICENILQYDGDDYMGLIRGPVQLDYYSIDALWTLVEIDDNDPDGIFIYFKFTFQRGVQLFWFDIAYDTSREIASANTFTQVLSVFDPVPGNCIRYNGNDNTINWHTTAVITDIQQVAALPANPVPTVLYLIPAT